MKKNKAGLGNVFFIIAFLLILSLGLIGWRINSSSKKTQPSISNEPPELYTDTAGKFSFYYPRKWKIAFAEGSVPEDKKHISPHAVQTETSSPVILNPNEGQKDNNVIVTPGCSAASVTEMKAKRDQFHTQEDLTINGYTAFYDKLDFMGDAESYLHHTYIILGTSGCVEIGYRESWHHPMSNTTFNDSKNMDAFRSIINSTKFLSQ